LERNPFGNFIFIHGPLHSARAGPAFADGYTDERDHLLNKTKRDAREILSYFMRNPQAADTLEGMVRWRLLSEVVHRKVDETRAALEWLVERGLLLETRSPGVGPIFSLNPEKIPEAQGILDAVTRTSSQKKAKGK